jgi:hypothetical protein
MRFFVLARPLAVSPWAVAQNALARWEEGECADTFAIPRTGRRSAFRSQFRRDVVPRL